MTTSTSRGARRLALVAVAGAVLLTSACSSSGGQRAGTPSPSGSADAPTASVQKVTVHVTDQLRFVPATIRVHPGTVRVTLVDDGSYPHDLAIGQLHARSADVSGNPGEQSTTMTLHLVKPGTYDFVCTYHASAGMRGELVVS